MNKIFAFDIDGTILNSQDKMLPSTIKALKETKKRGHINVIATGRPFIDTNKSLKQYDFFSYYICNNGTYIYDIKNNKMIFDKIVLPEIASILLDEVYKHNAIFIVHTDKDTYRSIVAKDEIDFDDPNWQEMKKFNFIPLDEVIEKLQYEKITQVSIRSTKKSIIQINEAFKPYKDLVNIFIANKVYFDINPKGVSKFYGLKKIMQITHHKKEDIIAFGDSGNDLEMLKMSGKSFCMENGSDVAKEAADEVIGNNDTNTIALKIAELLKEK